jgi:3-hydroxymyristoyl/3-hydroxydecanoyl-(acyl carrier protein) dehydratase
MPGKRGDFLGCVLVEGSRGRLSALELRKLMLPEFPKGTVPKRFRFVDRLPRNAQGKVVAAEVVAMLEHVEIPLRFSGDEHFFQGHFPGAPILPGVVQLGLAVENAKKAYGFDGALKMAKKLKFVHIIEPGHDIVLSLSKSGDGEVKYEFSEGGALCSSGTLVF